MTGWNYIVFSCDRGLVGKAGHDYEAICFPPTLEHSDVARQFPKAKPVSGGSIRLVADEDAVRVECYGGAPSLGLHHHKDDEDFFNEP